MNFGWHDNDDYENSQFAYYLIWTAFFGREE